MGVVETLAERNAKFAEVQFDSDLRMRPKLATIVVCCADTRVDPVMVLGAEPGEIMAIRNIGGRITPGVLEELFMLRNVAGSVGDEYEGWELIVMQHTQCGILRLKDRPELLAPYFEVDESELGGKSVADPYKAVVQDVAALRADARLAAVRTSGLVYDVATGLVEIVVAP